MLMKSIFSTLGLLPVPQCLALELAELIPLGVDQGISKRAANAGNGVSLSAGTCPSNTTSCGMGACCSQSLQCIPVGTIWCCPDGTDCSITDGAHPACADSTWVLWNVSNSYLCCEKGQIGDKNGICNSASTTLTSTTLISHPLSTHGRIEATDLRLKVASASTSSTSAATKASASGSFSVSQASVTSTKAAASSNSSTSDQTVIATTTYNVISTTTNEGFLGKVTFAVGSVFKNEAASNHGLGVEIIMGTLGFLLSGFMAFF